MDKRARSNESTENRSVHPTPPTTNDLLNSFQDVTPLTDTVTTKRTKCVREVRLLSSTFRAERQKKLLFHLNMEQIKDLRVVVTDLFIGILLRK